MTLMDVLWLPVKKDAVEMGSMISVVYQYPSLAEINLVVLNCLKQNGHDCYPSFSRQQGQCGNQNSQKLQDLNQ